LLASSVSAAQTATHHLFVSPEHAASVFLSLCKAMESNPLYAQAIKNVCSENNPNLFPGLRTDAVVHDGEPSKSIYSSLELHDTSNKQSSSSTSFTSDISDQHNVQSTSISTIHDTSYSAVASNCEVLPPVADSNTPQQPVLARDMSQPGQTGVYNSAAAAPGICYSEIAETLCVCLAFILFTGSSSRVYRAASEAPIPSSCVPAQCRAQRCVRSTTRICPRYMPD
jgi:hypothetical protein